MTQVMFLLRLRSNPFRPERGVGRAWAGRPGGRGGGRRRRRPEWAGRTQRAGPGRRGGARWATQVGVDKVGRGEELEGEGVGALLGGADLGASGRAERGALEEVEGAAEGDVCEEGVGAFGGGGRALAIEDGPDAF